VGWQPGYHPDDLGNVLKKWRAAVAETKPLEVEAVSEGSMENTGGF